MLILWRDLRRDRLLEPFHPFFYSRVVVLATCLLWSGASVLMRYRRALGIERLQLKWLVAAGTIAAFAYPMIFFVVGDFSIQLVWALIPIAIGISVLRYRLYEIDRLMSRTVTYLVVVVLLGAVYAAGVFLVQLLPIQGDVAVAGSTLLVAALFNPLRRPVQAAVDRRFNRSRYDAERIVAGFSGVLRGRVDPDEVLQAWKQVVAETMQPAAMGWWVAPGRR